MQSPRSHIVKPFFRQIPLKQCAEVLLTLAALLRLPGLFGELQYDEIWSRAAFTGHNIFRILTDIELPNNHPVNTLVLKFLLNFSDSPAFMRLGVYLAGIAAVGLCGKIAHQITRSKSAAIAAMLLGATSPAMILYSITARGYIFQILGLQLLVIGLICSVQGSSGRKTLPLMIGGGIIACLSVSSGIMFLGVIAAGYLIFAPKERRFNRDAVIAAAVLALFSLSYYLPLYPKLKNAQHWGIDITSAGKWFEFAFNTLRCHLLPLTAILALPGVIMFPAMRKLFLLSLLPLLLAIVTHGGQARVYLILTPFFIIIAATGFGECFKRFEKYRIWLSLLFVAGCITTVLLPPEVWKLPTPSEDLQAALKNIPETVLPVLPASAGMPVSINSAAMQKELEIRAANHISGILLLNTAPEKLNGADMSTAEKTIDFPLPGINSPETGGRFYPLTPVAYPEKIDNWYLIILTGEPPETLKNWHGEIIRLNIWLNKAFKIFVCRGKELPPPFLAQARYYQFAEVEK